MLNKKEIRSSPLLVFRKKGKSMLVNTGRPFLHRTRNKDLSNGAISDKHQEKPEPGDKNEIVASWNFFPLQDVSVKIVPFKPEYLAKAKK